MAAQDAPANPPSVDELCRRVRQFINDRRRQFILMQDTAAWFQVCVALDTIGDAEFGISSFQPAGTAGVGQGYLLLHGLMQCLFMQQDAVSDLASALGGEEKWSQYPRLEEIREFRNDVTGHPTRRDRDRKRPSPSFHAIIRMSVGTDHLEVLSSFPDGHTELRPFILTEIISDQKLFVSEMLGNVVAVLKADEGAHREKFRMERLADLFGGQRTYAIEKIHEAAGETFRPGLSTHALGVWGVERLQGICTSFREALEQRGSQIETYDAVKFHYGRLEYALEELQRYFADPDTSAIASDTLAEVVATFIQTEMDALEGLARELDEYYSEPVK